MGSRFVSNHREERQLGFWRSFLAMLGVCFVAMLAALDQTVVGTALPTIVSELRGFDLYAWVATSYLLTTVVMVPIAGRLGDHYGRKPLVLCAVVVFTLASVLCAQATSMPILLLARGLQGIGGGMLLGTVFACVADLFPSSVTRLRWQIMLSSSFGVANAIGPSLGGVLTQYAGWRSVFLVNIPTGIVSLFFVWRFLPGGREKDQSDTPRIDWIGAILIATSLGCLQSFVTLVPTEKPIGLSIMLLAISIASAILLFNWESRCANAMIPMEIIRDRNVSVLLTLAILTGFAMFSLIFYVPLMFQAGFAMEPKEAGIYVTPLVVFITIGSIVNGRIVTRIRNSSLMLRIGFAFLAIACIGSTTIDFQTPKFLLAVYMIFGGMGFGMIMPNLMVFVQLAAGRSKIGIATALVQSLRMIGGLLGTALTGTFVTYLYRYRVDRVIEKEGSMPWMTSIRNPQILMNRGAERVLAGKMTGAGDTGEMLVETARNALLNAIHVGFAFAAVIAIVGILQSCRVPRINLQKKANSKESTSSEVHDAA